jgi:Fe-S-cluster-containing hydrogenase component 2
MSVRVVKTSPWSCVVIEDPPCTEPCPHTGLPFDEISGYVEGYGCPACKGLSYHTLMPKAEAR